MEKKRSNIIFACFLAYFIILFGERIYAVVASFLDPEIGFLRMFVRGKFEIYIYGMICISLFAFIVFFLFSVGKIISVGVEKSFKMLLFSAGVLLIGGMLHCEHTLVLVQFISYIFLFIGCLLRYLDIAKENEHLGSTIASYAYLVAFSMAVPVVSKTEAGNKNIAFYVVEALGSLALVVIFTIMLIVSFTEKYKFAYNPVFLFIMVGIVGIMTLLVLGTNDINMFSLVACIITIIAYVVLRVLLARDRKPKIV